MTPRQFRMALILVALFTIGICLIAFGEQKPAPIVMPPVPTPAPTPTPRTVPYEKPLEDWVIRASALHPGEPAQWQRVGPCSEHVRRGLTRTLEIRGPYMCIMPGESDEWLIPVTP